MHILNVLFNPWLGGVETAFRDYCDVLTKRGHTVTAIVPPGAKILPALSQLTVAIIEEQKTRRNFGPYDVLTIHRFRKLLQRLRPDVVVVHNGRPLALFRKAAKGICPVVVVNHGSNPKRTVGVDRVLAVNHTMRQQIIAAGQPEDSVFIMPNMIEAPARLKPPQLSERVPPVIGSLGRLSYEKGFDLFLETLAILKSRGVSFKAVLAGEGGEKEKLLSLADKLQLNDVLTFAGWVTDKQAFFSGIDIFCLPSRYESFGIVLLEAFLYGTAAVATDADGPRELIEPGKNGFLVKRDSPEAMADALIPLLQSAELRYNVATAAYEKVQAYTMERAGALLEQYLQEVITTKETA